MRHALLLLLIGCSGRSTQAPNTHLPSSAVMVEDEDLTTKEDHIDLVVENGRIPAGGTRNRSVAGTPLSDADVNSILSRLPDLEGGEKAAFRLRPDSKPPPRTESTVDVPFPPPTAPDVPDVPTGPLSVLSITPEGEVPVAPKLSVTFDRPMVALTTQDNAASTVPITLAPQPEGRWRWVGTRTLLFESPLRLPMATSYTVTVPAGVTSANGEPLDKAVISSFATPPLTLLASSPSKGQSSTPRDPVIVLRFDQTIDPKALLPFLSLDTKLDTPLRLAEPAEIAADKATRSFVEASEAGRWIAVRPLNTLPGGTTVNLTVGEGAVSAEGPRLTEAAQQVHFTTYGEFTHTETKCGWKKCSPSDQWTLTFSNLIDTSVDVRELVEVSPDPGRALWVYGNVISLGGPAEPNTTYTITVDGSLKDTFGQTLGETLTTTVNVKDAEPLHPNIYTSSEIRVTDPSGTPSARFQVQGLDKARLRVHRVTASDLAAWTQRRDDKLPGTVVVDEMRDIEDSRFVQRSIDIDLSPYVEDHGHLLVELSKDVRQGRRSWKTSGQTWVTTTDIGLSHHFDEHALYAWTSDLQTGTPRGDVEILYAGKSLGRTDANGLLKVALPRGNDGQPIVARFEGDEALLTSSGARWSNGFQAQHGAERWIWHVLDDRGLYRPGETVHIHGWARQVDLGLRGDVSVPQKLQTPMRWTLRDAQNVELASGTEEWTGQGTFAFDVVLPDTPNLGRARFEFTSEVSWAHAIDIREFRRPEFEVSASLESSGPHVVRGEHAVAAVRAAYFAGGPLSESEARWNIMGTYGSWRPPGHDEFRFGEWIPWWFRHHSQSNPDAQTTMIGTTDSDGVHRISLGVDAVWPPRPVSVQASASVQDVNRQSWTSTTQVLIHPSERYVGIRPSANFYRKGEDVDVDIIVTDLDGEARAGSDVEVALLRRTWRWKPGGAVMETDVLDTCTVTSADAPVNCAFQKVDSGSYQLRARVRDDQGRLNQSTLTTWVSGAQTKQENRVVMEAVTLVPDKEAYAPGDTAKILAMAPFAPAEAVVSYRRGGIESLERVPMEDGSAVLEVPITDKHHPNLLVHVEVVGQAPRSENAKGPQRPAVARGVLDLPIPPTPRSLAVEVKPASSSAMPGASTSVKVVVRDAAGSPVPNAHVVMMAVDEAVLALSNHTIADPLDTFHPKRQALANDQHNRLWIALQDVPPPEALEGRGFGGSGVGGGGMVDHMDAEFSMAAEAAPAARRSRRAMAKSAPGAPPPPPQEANAAQPAIELRSDFRPDALWLPTGTTDASGVVEIPWDLPDNLTRYRIRALASDPGRGFGKGSADLTARLPVMLRPSAPRFLRFGDKAELPFVVQNQSDDELTVSLAAIAQNATFDGKDRAGRRFTVPANDRVEVRLPVDTDMAGEAAFQAAITAGSASDAATFTLPVYTPATAEAFAVYGSLEGDARTVALKQPIDIPDDVWPQHGGLEINTSTTAVAALTDAVIYLYEYRFSCSEQLASRILAIAALRDVLDAFDAEGLPPKAQLDAYVLGDIDALVKRQNSDGGWSWWRRDQDSRAMPSVHAVHALVRAKEAGYDVPQGALDRALNRIRTIDPLLRDWGERARNSVRAQAIHVRHLAGQDTAKDASRILSAGNDELGAETLGWLLPSLPTSQHAGVMRWLENKVTETAANAQITVSYGEEAGALILHSSRRTDAVVMDAMLQVTPDHRLIEKFARSLLDHRVKGRWGSTQENAWVLLGLNRYFEVRESVTPDLVARAWVGAGFAGEHTYKGRTTETARIDVPMAWLKDGHDQDDLILAREGKGRLYYRLGLRYAPRDLVLDAAEYGFSVLRTYESVDDPGDVRKNSDGIWEVKAGTRVRVKLTMVAPERRYHVALVDPLPAGLEALDPDLPATGAPPSQKPRTGGYFRWWWGPWYAHENLRDDRVEAFTTLLWPGVHEYSYVARATTPGTFVVPPAKAEEMYHPETFGRSASETLVVVP